MPVYNTPNSNTGTGATPWNGVVRQNGGWGHGAVRNAVGVSGNQLSTIQYINPAAFISASSVSNPNCTAAGTACEGMVIGNTARTAPYGLRGPGNYDLDGDLRRTFDLWKDGRVKFIFEASVFNAVNHVWFGSSASTANGSVGSSVGGNVAYNSSGVLVNSDPAFGAVTGQANSPRQWQFAGHITV
jgi:hypothetical protein